MKGWVIKCNLIQLILCKIWMVYQICGPFKRTYLNIYCLLMMKMIMKIHNLDTMNVCKSITYMLRPCQCKLWPACGISSTSSEITKVIRIHANQYIIFLEMWTYQKCNRTTSVERLKWSMDCDFIGQHVYIVK